MLDYEGELTVIIGRDAKNVSESEALDYVLVYTSGNEVSARNFQLKENSGGQVCYAKSFDTFVPIGPAIISTRLIPDPQKVHYVAKVNGEVRQDIETKDMIWSVRQIIAFLSRGTTMRKGTVIMTGISDGIGWFQGKLLKDGDIVEVDIEGFSKISNKLVFS
jgi:2-keto-4-pentenoate hydratase/2-oxohepta-3-ene-1,7-dioic acid hydratase in catechol pathway